MVTQAETTLPRDMSGLAYRDPFPVARMARVDPPSHPVSSAPIIGQRMPDGTVYAGISPDSGRPMYATPKDAGLCRTWYEAIGYAKRLDVHGAKDWRVPTPAELDRLYEARNEGALKGTFNTTGSFPSGWYWSSLHGVQNFGDGYWTQFHFENLAASLRCVRG